MAHGSCNSANRSGSSAKPAAPLRISAHSQRSESSSPACSRMRATSCSAFWCRSLTASAHAAASSSRGRRSSSSGGSFVSQSSTGRLPLPHQALVQAVLGEVIGDLAPAGRQRVTGRALEHSLFGQPAGGARVEFGTVRPAGSSREARTQDVARHRMHAHPLAVLGADENRRLARQPREPLRDASSARTARGKGRDAGDRRSRPGSGTRRPRDRGSRRSTPTKWPCSSPLRVAIALIAARASAPRAIAAKRELQAERPALGQLVQAWRTYRCPRAVAGAPAPSRSPRPA